VPKNVKNNLSNVDFDGILLFLALGFIVGLPSFIVGTALFMLGFSTENSVLVGVASLLYGIALAAIGGRVVLRKYPPSSESQALVIGVGALGVMATVYGVLNAIFWLLHLPSGFGG
jgi:dolichol kinase